jgi:DNA-binding transcriptional MerR regulator
LTLESIPGFSLPDVEEKALRSGEVARQAGVSPDTLRHYERVGVLPRPRRGANGYRQYDGAAVDRVRLVRRSLAVGFTLEELARILAARERGSPPCRQVRRLAAEKLEQLEKRMAEMQHLKEELARTIRDWDARLAVTPAGKPALLLESLAAGKSMSLPAWPKRGPVRKEKK